jgi:hypothetical protein
VAAGLTVAMLPATVLPALSAQASSTAWRVSHVVSTGHPAVLSTVTTTSRSDAWAFGLVKAARITGVVRHWTGKTWNRVTLPAAVAKRWSAGDPLAVSGSAPGGNVWAFSAITPTYLHHDASGWSAGSLPNPDQTVIQPSATIVRSASEAWVFGGAEDGPGGTFVPYAAMWNGLSWTTVPVPGTGPIVAASAVSLDDFWAVTGTQEFESSVTTSKPVLLHWDGISWSTVHLPARLPGSPSSILAVSDHDVWIGGRRPNGPARTEYAAQYTGTALHVHKLRVAARQGSFSMVRLVKDGHGGVWGLGVAPSLLASRLWHLTGGSWHGPIEPRLGRRAALLWLARVPNTASVWGSGHVGSANGLIAVDGRLP